MEVEVLNAIYENDLPKIKQLLDSSNVDNPLTTYLLRPLHFAIRTQNKTLIEFLVKELNAQVNCLDINGWSPLGLIAVEGSDKNYELAQLLISLGADVDYSTRESNYYSPMELASDNRDSGPEVFKLFKTFSKNQFWETKKNFLVCFERLSQKLL